VPHIRVKLAKILENGLFMLPWQLGIVMFVRHCLLISYMYQCQFMS